MPLSERLKALERLQVAVVICGGISETLYKLLQTHNIESIHGIAGDVDEVIRAFCGNRLKEDQFACLALKSSFRKKGVKRWKKLQSSDAVRIWEMGMDAPENGVVSKRQR